MTRVFFIILPTIAVLVMSTSVAAAHLATTPGGHNGDDGTEGSDEDNGTGSSGTGSRAIGMGRDRGNMGVFFSGISNCPPCRVKNWNKWHCYAYDDQGRCHFGEDKYRY
ncbi:hypothetical protein K457DRAFT_886826 [Linnemannia elongata AG-77]|uniref:CBM1 domain-containing protein n=1 Tax=Linnemannia elongata AG-77 TaxID=1314771 RepID=A0A197JEF2_9FUNG|nr:hypothetical protein K457DRAFT_886826 [Linnemannia elongata AG-77]